MAKTPVTLKVDGFADREVAEVNYNFSRGTNNDGQPSGPIRGGVIVLKVKALNDGNCDLFDWINSTGSGKNGSIEFMDSRDHSKKMKAIEFENAYCVDFTEHWEDKSDNSQELAHYETIKISCQKIINQSVAYENPWV
jgi:hypothetical protein